MRTGGASVNRESGGDSIAIELLREEMRRVLAIVGEVWVRVAGMDACSAVVTHSAGPGGLGLIFAPVP